jgi:hypothetical protein
MIMGCWMLLSGTNGSTSLPFFPPHPAVRYPPYSQKSLNTMKSLMTFPELPAILPSTLRNVTIAALGVIAFVVARHLS